MRTGAAIVPVPSDSSPDRRRTQCATARLTVAERMVPFGARDQRKRTHPSLGSFTCPHVRPKRWTVMRGPSGKRKEGFH